MADSMEKVQDQQQQLKQKHQIQNHSDGVNGESTPDSVIQPKQTIGKQTPKIKKKQKTNSS